MNIIGPDTLVFGVDDVDACSQFLTDYGLTPVGVDSNGGRFEAMDGTGLLIRDADDPTLPRALLTGNLFRETIYGVADAAALDAIGAELSRDREVKAAADGSLHAVDDVGFAIGFEVTRRHPFVAPAV